MYIRVLVLCASSRHAQHRKPGKLKNVWQVFDYFLVLCGCVLLCVCDPASSSRYQHVADGAHAIITKSRSEAAL